MGIMICETHSQTGIGLVSPVLRGACRENRRIPRDQIVAVHVTIHDDDPPEMAETFWLDSSTAARLAVPVDRMLDLDDAKIDALFPGLEPVCGTCFSDWLRLNGVDTSPRS
jgi:hypothetical protein